MESWRRVFRVGVEPLLSMDNLVNLKNGLEADDPHILQGATTSPPPLTCVEDWPVEGACLIGYMGAMDMGGFVDVVIGQPCNNPGAATVGNVEEFFGRMCYAIDQRLGEPAGCRFLLNWFDETPRDVVRECMIYELKLAINARLMAEVPAFVQGGI